MTLSPDIYRKHLKCPLTFCGVAIAMSALPPKAAGLEIAIHFATDSSLAQTLTYLGSDAPPIKLAPLL
jgi:hypothetical protein